MAEFLRDYELRLLRCTLSPPPSDSIPNLKPPPSDSPNLHAHINQLLTLIEAGEYLHALSSDSSKLFLRDFPDSTHNPDQVYSELVGRLERFVSEGCDEEERACRGILVICVAIAAFFCFTQRNITGPLDEFPCCPLPLEVAKGGDWEEWEDWARAQLMSGSSHLVGRLYNLQYIVFAKMLVMRTKDLLFEGSSSSSFGFKSVSWWLARILLVEQRILDELSSSLFDLLQVYSSETLRQFGTLDQIKCYWGDKLPNREALDIVSMAHLEAGIMEHIYGRADQCRRHLDSAALAADLQLSVTGVLGYRTVHQREPKAQRVLVTNRSLLTHDGTGHMLEPSQYPDLDIVEDTSHRHKFQSTETDDIFMTPKLLEKGAEVGISSQVDNDLGANPLKAIQQAVILAQCLLIDRSSREDEMQITVLL